jgi:hypothetical protein
LGVLTAQTTTSGELTGVVTDRSGAVLPNAEIEIKDIHKYTIQSTRTNREGIYEFFFLAPSTYTLTVTQTGFQKVSRAVTVSLGAPVTVNFRLEIAKASSEINVTAETPLLRVEDGDVSVTVNQTQISEVPNPGNDITYIAQTAPGVVMNTDYGTGLFSALGMSGTANLFTIDGLNVNDNGPNLPLVGATFLLLGQNQVQEATVVCAGYSGQIGGAAGTNVNYLTKSGSTAFHGNAQYYWNGRAFNANDWFIKAASGSRPFDIANQWAASLGGPIRKGRLFFFLDTEGLRLLIPKVATVTIPTTQFEAVTIANLKSAPNLTSASLGFYQNLFDLYNNAVGASSAIPFGPENQYGCDGFEGLGGNVPCGRYFVSQRPSITDETLVSGRIDWLPRESDRAFLRLQYDFGDNSFYADPISPIFDAHHRDSWWQGALTETHTFTSLAASQLLLAGMFYTDRNELKHPAAAISSMPVMVNFSYTGTFTNFATANSLAVLNGRPTTEFQIAENLVKIWKNHKLGGGANFQRIYWTNQSYGLNAVGTVSPQTLDAFYYGGINPASPTTDFTQLTQSFPTSLSERISFYNLGAYGQDEWHVRPNLAITLAFRAEHYSNPVCRDHCFARFDGSFDSSIHDPSQAYKQAIAFDQQAYEATESMLWSPRIGFAWQPFGVTHNTVLRGGVGFFYDPLPGDLTWTLSSNPPLLNSYAIVGDNLVPGESTSLSKDAAESNAAFTYGFKNGQTLAQIQHAIQGFYPPGFSPPAMTTLGKRTSSPQYQKWSLELQQAFHATTSVNIGYYGHHGIHELVQNANANAYGFGSLPPGLCISPPVPPCADPRFGQVTEDVTTAVSNYNGAVISFQHRLTQPSRGLFQLNYTFGHALDETSNGGLYGFTSTGLIYPQDPKNLRGAYGPADYDVRHSLNGNYVWEVPVKTALGGRGPDVLTKGWQVSGTVFAHSGLPYTVIDVAGSGSLVAHNSFGLIYAVPARPLTSGPSCGQGAAYVSASRPCQPPQMSDGAPNPNALFLQSGCATGFNTGNLPGLSGPCSGSQVTFAQGRNYFRGPSYFNTDFAITKRTKIPHWESSELGIGFQFFNLFNHPNFGFPDIFLADSTFGEIFNLEQPPTSILGAGLGDVAPRMIQLKVQLQF